MADNRQILVGPRHGTDVGIIEIGGQAVSLTCDPVFIIPEYGWERAAWFAIQILASDSVTSGLSPRYLSIDLNLPMEITKGPAIEACGIFAAMFPRMIIKEFGEDFARRADKLFSKLSVVEEARLAASCGVRNNGVTAMHDATECGIWGGLFEIAEAAGCGITVNQDKIVVEDCVKEICSLFQIDPYASISEGTLIIACRANYAQQIVESITDRGILASIAGEFTEKSKGIVLLKNGRIYPLRHPNVDPFWKAFYDGTEKYKTYIN